MGYFANGTEGMSYQDHYCQKCENWTAREGDSGVGCPIIDMHMIDNYELCNVKDNYLNKLIPRSENGLFNVRCVMFLPQKMKEDERYTTCDLCGAGIDCNRAEDFFLEPPVYKEPVVLCENCFVKIEAKTS